MEWWDHLVEEWGIWGLFVSAFVSSTLLPGGSEALLMLLVVNGEHALVTLLIAATVGNTLGGLTSWGLGWWLASRLTADSASESHRRAIGMVKRWGSPLLLLSWLPVVGDPLCVAAGWLRINLIVALLLIALGKAVRYSVLLCLIA